MERWTIQTRTGICSKNNKDNNTPDSNQKPAKVLIPINKNMIDIIMEIFNNVYDTNKPQDLQRVMESTNYHCNKFGLKLKTKCMVITKYVGA